MKQLLLGLTLCLSPSVLAETYICPAELLETGLVQLQRSGDHFVLTHGVLGTQRAELVGESDGHLCASFSAMDDASQPVIYLFCVDKTERSVAISYDRPFGEDSDGPEMNGWTHSKCFFRSDGPI